MQIEIPDNKERNIYIFSGLQLVKKRENGIWYDLVTPCNMCGECCKRVPDNWWLGRNEKGWCEFLKEYEVNRYICSADRPFGCATGDYADEEWCCIKWRQQ